MRRFAVLALVLVLVAAAVTGSGGFEPSAQPSSSVHMYLWVSDGRIPLIASRNPGTGTGDPLLVAALLPQPASGYLSQFLVPPAVMALPDRDRQSLFITIREVPDPVTGPAECAGFTAGLWYEVTRSFNEAGVQLAVTESALTPSSPQFAEEIITGPPALLGRLADQTVPARCRTITSPPYSGGVRTLAAARVGLGSRAFEVTGTAATPVWIWAEVVRGPGFILEVRIPYQPGSPGSDDLGASLAGITAAAYQRAITTLDGS